MEVLWLAVGTRCLENCYSKIEVSALNLTLCAFVGEKLDSLFITTAYVGMNDEQKSKFPLAGSVFVATPAAKGVKSDFFVE